MSNQTDNLSEKIAQIKAQQEALVRQTNEELEVLKKTLEETKRKEEAELKEREQERGPLLEEIKFLRDLVKELEQEKRQQEAIIHQKEAEIQRLVNSVKAAINVPITEEAPLQLPKVEEEAFFEPPEPIKKALKAKKARVALSAPKLPKLKLNPPKVKTPRLSLPQSPRKVALRAVGVALFATLVWVTWTHSPFRASDEIGQVAGVSTVATSDLSSQSREDVSFPEYKQSYSDVSYADTEWQKSVDPDFGISIEYPANASNRVGAVGGNNIWFLRKDAYLLKLTREQYEGSLDEWMAENKAHFEDTNSLTKTTFKDLDAWLIKPLSQTDGYGYEYVVQIETTIYQVWIKTEDPASDDGQRIAQMVTSLQFTK